MTPYHVIRTYKGCYNAEELIRKIIRLHIAAEQKTNLETTNQKPEDKIRNNSLEKKEQENGQNE